MLFNDRILFLHVPKTAGISVTRFLIDNVPGPFTITLPRGHQSPLPSEFTIEGKRHERLADAQRLLSSMGRKLSDFEVIIASMRNPYDMEVSYYHYKKLGHKYDAGKAQSLALAGDFLAFARHAPYYGRLPARIEDWYQFGGVIPPNLAIVRFESLREDLFRIVSAIHPIRYDLPRENITKHDSYQNYLTPEVEKAIYEKYRWIFDRGFYRRNVKSPEQVQKRLESANDAIESLRAKQSAPTPDEGTRPQTGLSPGAIAELVCLGGTINPRDAERIIAASFAEMAAVFRERDDVSIPGLGSFIRIRKNARYRVHFLYCPLVENAETATIEQAH